MKPYQFAVLRYVHDRSIGEFANVGILMWLPDTYEMDYLITNHTRRLSKFFSDFDGNNYRSLIKYLDNFFKLKKKELNKDKHAPQIFNTAQPDINILLQYLVPDDGTCFEWSEVMSGVNVNPLLRLHSLFAEFVVQAEEKQPEHRYDEQKVWSTIYHEMVNKGLQKHVKQNVKLASKKYDYLFKAGWMNGKQQLIEPISFDLLNNNEILEKANKWFGRLARLSQDNKFAVTMVVAPPQKEDAKDYYSDSFETLKGAPSVREVITEKELKKYFNKLTPEIMANPLVEAE